MTERPVPDALRRSRLLGWAALGVVYVVWGTTYLAIRVGVRDLPPLLFAGLRFVAAGALLFPVAWRLRRPGPRPGRSQWLGAGAVGFLLLAVGNGGVNVAETKLASGLTAVLVATVPLWTVVFSRVLQDRVITARVVAGLVVGLGGVAVLAGNLGGTRRFSYVVVVCGAAAVWGFATVLGRRVRLPQPVLLASAVEMLAGGAALVLAAAATGEFSRARWGHVGATSWFALAYLVVFGSIVAFSAFTYALEHLPVSTVSTYAFVNPVVAVVAGAVLLGEHLSAREGLGALLVLGSLAMIRERPPAAVEEWPGHAGEVTTWEA